MALHFSFDLNKCTGCNACQIACSLENQVDWGTNWRQVLTYNQDHIPGVSLYHLSMACNHCGDPPCMKFCPALAISKDADSGIVNIDPSKCIGCKYCSWVCPYDAPRFNRHDRVMEKCTFCTQRLEENTDPACVALCPTGALDYEESEQIVEYPEVPGFNDYNIKPALHLIPLRKDHTPQTTSDEDLPFDSDLVQKFRSDLAAAAPRITLGSEWTLLVFTLVAAILVGIRAKPIVAELPVSPLLFLLSGVMAMLISSLHLGRIFRAYRALFNWRRSWLSREIIFFSLFLVLSAVQDWIFTNSIDLSYITFGTGLAALFCMDSVYGVVRKEDEAKWHSALLVLSGLYFAGIVSASLSLAIPAGLLKLFLYMKRCGKPGWEESLRIVTGFIAPAFLWYYYPGLDHMVILAVVLAGEIIDRIDFYRSLIPASPAGRFHSDLSRSLEIRTGN